MKFVSLIIVSCATLLMLGCSGSDSTDSGNGDEIVPIGTAKHVSARGE